MIVLFAKAYVRGHTRKDGTQVRPYTTRRPPAASKPAGKAPQQVALFDAQGQPTRQAAGRDAKRRVVAYGIAAKIESQGSAALVGSKVTSPAQLAEVAQCLRNPRYETLRYVLVKDGKVVHASGVTQRLPDAASLFPDDYTPEQFSREMAATMIRTGADGYYMLHNHPSGNPTPSLADIRATENVRRQAVGFLGHVVINSGRYAVIDANGGVTMKDIAAPEKVLKPARHHAVLGRSITSPESAVDLARDLKRPGWDVIAVMSHQLQVRAIIEVAPEITADPKRLRSTVARMVKSAGGRLGFLLAEKIPPHATDMIRDGYLQDAVSFDGQSLVQRGAWPTGDKWLGNDPRAEHKAQWESGAERLDPVPAAGGRGRQELPMVAEPRPPQTETPEFRRWFGDSKVVDADGNPLVVYHGGESPITDFSRSAKRGGSLGLAFFTDSMNVAESYARTGVPPNFDGDKADREGSVTSVYLSIKNPVPDDPQEFFNGDMERAFSFVKDDLPDFKVYSLEEMKDAGDVDGFWESLRDEAEFSLSEVSQAHESLSGSPFLQYIAGTMERSDRFRARVFADFDGFIFDDAESGGTTYVAFRPEQIKSATGNRGTFDPADPDITKALVLFKAQPTEAQAEAGNYRKGTIRWRGLSIAVENPVGSVRTGTDPDGHEWRTVMRAAYGYIRRSKGTDDEQIDCYVGPDPDAPMVYVVNQVMAGEWHRPDEQKCMIGFADEDAARAAYLAHYDDPRFLGSITAMTAEDFVDRVRRSGNAPRDLRVA